MIHDFNVSRILAVREENTAEAAAEQSSSSLAVPRFGHVLTTAAEKSGGPIRSAVSLLARHLQTGPILNIWDSYYATRKAEPGSPMKRGLAELSGWNLVATWVVAVATRALPDKATLKEAESWFFGGQANALLTSHLSVEARAEAEQMLHSVADSKTLSELLPYILDPHGPGSRLSVRKEPETRSARARKRAEGVFYTPQDVAAYMAREALQDVSTGAHPLTVFDPACGTGVFLKAAFQALKRLSPQADLLDMACSCLYGADIDPWSLDASAYVLLHSVMDDVNRRRVTPLHAWHAIRLNLSHVDTLRMDPPTPSSQRYRRERLELRAKLKCGDLPPRDQETAFPLSGPISISEIFPDIGSGPRVIIGNPPYADIGLRNDLLTLVKRFETLRAAPRLTSDVYPLFAEQMIRLAAPDAHGGALVLPLSIACNSGGQFRATRTLIANTPGHWRFAFFDREPHALFGEDVKTRNAIVLWSKQATEQDVSLSTGPLQKWRGNMRAQMFKEIRFTPFKGDIVGGVPKISGALQAQALEHLLQQTRTLKHAVVDIGRSALAQSVDSDEKTVHVASTAYNFLSVFLRPEIPQERRESSLSENPIHTLTCANTDHTFAVFAALNSYLAFWWWHVNGDGFHVTRRTLEAFPIGAALNGGNHEIGLASLGSRLWKAMRAQPVFSLNRGRRSVGFSAAPFGDLRLQIDRVLLEATGLDRSIAEALERFSQGIAAARLIHDDQP